MMVAMNAFTPNAVGLKAAAAPANNMAEVKAQADAVKLQAEALENNAKKAKPAHAGTKLDVQG
jgi:hypothetical protein